MAGPAVAAIDLYCHYRWTCLSILDLIWPFGIEYPELAPNDFKKSNCFCDHGCLADLSGVELAVLHLFDDCLLLYFLEF